MQLAQLSRDASAAVRSFVRCMIVFCCFSSCGSNSVKYVVSQGAARRSTSQQKNVEVDSVGVSKKSDFNRTVKYFIQEVRKLI